MRSSAFMTQTYFPSEKSQENAEIISLIDELRKKNKDIVQRYPYLADRDGKKYDLPENIIQPLLLIAEALNEGKAVTVAPIDQVLTTQEAADFLGVSRPTLVALLEKGAIPFKKISRHRRVKLTDLLAYQEEKSREVRASLRELSRLEHAEGIAERTLGIPPAMR